jgi:hypothetical protein
MNETDESLVDVVTGWVHLVENIFWGDELEPSHNDLQSKYEEVVSKGPSSVLDQFNVQKDDDRLPLTDMDEFDMEHKFLEAVLLRNARKIMLVDWLDDSFPTVIPDDLDLLGNSDIVLLNKVLKSNPFGIKYFHQLNLLPSYLKSAPVGSNIAHIYRQLPEVSWPYAYECANKCQDIFTAEGRKNLIQSSRLYIIESEVTANEFKKIVETEMKRVHLTRGKKKRVQWILDDSYVSELIKQFGRGAEDPFMHTLSHGKWTDIPFVGQIVFRAFADDMKKKFKYVGAFCLESLHPYIVSHSGMNLNKKMMI